MRRCAYLENGRCQSPRCELKGLSPSAGFCAQCKHWTAFRGLGDLVHWVLGFLPSRKVKQMQLPVAQGGCGGCKARQDALNAAVPFGKCGSCAEKRESAQAP